MSIDTRYTYNPLPYNIVDKNGFNNRQGVNPSFQYRKQRVLWLNSAFATTNVSSGTTYFEFEFDVPPFQLYNQTKLRVISFTTNENAAKPFYIKVKDLMFDSTSIWCSDKEGFPMLYVNHVGAHGFLNNNIHSITLVPQLISSITLKINDSFTSRDTGYTISGAGAGHFIIGLLFEDDELIADNTVSQYK
jgi:hypothetical protein